MAYVTRKPSRLFFDLETQANPENLALASEPKAPANLKDPVKIAAAIEEKKAELIANAALDPDYGKILSIGMSYGDEIDVLVVGDCLINIDGTIEDTEGNPVSFTQKEFYTEAKIIEIFWHHFADCGGNCVGYNILGFDLPYLMRRSMALGVKVPFIPNLAKFRTEPITDLMAILYNWGSDRYKGLKQVAKLYGITNECPDVDGSKVKDLTTEQLRAYQASDVKLVIDLYKRMNGVYFCH